MTHPNDLIARERYRQLKPYIGNVVPVRMHMGPHMGEPRDMLYAGQAKDGDRYSWAEFILSRVEGVDGKIGFNGVYCHLEHIGVEDSGEPAITIYNTSDQYPHTRILCKPQRLKTLEELWKNRDKRK
jgi:hypothetical protein